MNQGPQQETHGEQAPNVSSQGGPVSILYDNRKPKVAWTLFLGRGKFA
jgi:hypothetical protein